VGVIVGGWVGACVCVGGGGRGVKRWVLEQPQAPSYVGRLEGARRCHL
jgi:hypothetical protein